RAGLAEGPGTLRSALDRQRMGSDSSRFRRPTRSGCGSGHSQERPGFVLDDRAVGDLPVAAGAADSGGARPIRSAGLLSRSRIQANPAGRSVGTQRRLTTINVAGCNSVSALRVSEEVRPVKRMRIAVVATLISLAI